MQTSPEFSLTDLHQEWQITESQIQAALCWQSTMPTVKQKELYPVVLQSSVSPESWKCNAELTSEASYHFEKGSFSNIVFSSRENRCQVDT